MSKQRRAKHERDDRPSVEELGGMSEYQVRAASDVEEGDPMQSVVQPAPDEAHDLMGPSMATGQPKGGAPNEELSVPPDELGEHFLKGAVQDQRPDERDAELPATEEIALSVGERRMLEGFAHGEAATEAELVTHLPDRAEREQEISEIADEVVREVQRGRRGARAEQAPERLKQERELATRRASARRH